MKTPTKRKAISKKQNREDFFDSLYEDEKKVYKKSKALDKAISKKVEDKWQKYWDDIPDAEATVEQIKNAGRWLGLKETPTNYWKWACVAILLGTVVGMITLTPTITSMFDACIL